VEGPVNFRVDLADEEGMKLKTRHSRDFRLCGESGKLDPSRSLYASSYPGVYEAKHKDLSDYLGTNQFLWCIDESEDFPRYESEKPMEWTIEIEESRRVGFVNDDRWLHFLENGHLPLSCFASKSGNPWGKASVSLLAAYRLRPHEIIGWRLRGENNSVIEEGTLEYLSKLDRVA